MVRPRRWGPKGRGHGPASIGEKKSGARSWPNLLRVKRRESGKSLLKSKHRSLSKRIVRGTHPAPRGENEFVPPIEHIQIGKKGGEESEKNQNFNRRDHGIGGRGVDCAGKEKDPSLPPRAHKKEKIGVNYVCRKIVPKQKHLGVGNLWGCIP